MLARIKTVYSDLPVAAIVLLWMGLAVNLYNVIPSAAWSISIFRRTWTMSLQEKYALLYPALYPDLEKIKQRVSEKDTLWLVSPKEPWHINYYLYPRTLRWGSPRMDDVEAIRQAHPSDWVISHNTLDPQKDRAWVYPPLNEKRSQP